MAVGCSFLIQADRIHATPSPLFSLNEQPISRSTAERTSPASVKESSVDLSISARSLLVQPEIEFPLFDGKLHKAKLIELERRGTNDLTWRGKIVGSEDDVSLTLKGGHMAGLIYSGDQVYEIVPKGPDHVLMQLDQDLFPLCGGAPTVADSGKAVQRSAGVSVDSGDRIDVLVLYTAAVRNTLGGTAQAQTFAQQAIDSTNTAYANSGIRQRIRLASALETTITEIGTLGAELSAIVSDATIASLRDQHKADLVALISNSSDNCGIGYLSAGNAAFGFTVTARNCAVGNLSFAHELGHNMGSHHNPENGGAGSAYPFSFGHYVNGVFRTVMSYTNPCPNGCPRRPYFSNPAVLFNGFPTGIFNARDNARSINLTADSTAAYRYSGSSITLEKYNGGDGVALPRRISRSIEWSSENVAGNVKIELSRNGGRTWETLVGNTANDGSETVHVFGRPVKTGRVRISSLNTPFVSDSSPNNVQIR